MEPVGPLSVAMQPARTLAWHPADVRVTRKTDERNFAFAPAGTVSRIGAPLARLPAASPWTDGKAPEFLGLWHAWRRQNNRKHIYISLPRWNLQCPMILRRSLASSIDRYHIAGQRAGGIGSESPAVPIRRSASPHAAGPAGERLQTANSCVGRGRRGPALREPGADDAWAHVACLFAPFAAVCRVVAWLGPLDRRQQTHPDV